ncbi:diphosphomevalonate decarboxylase [mine drainage metagenome]|uniref:Diphosphomevalonate decarboxylase n=1 Tax=mine drainage metagenome TaxID=410659 RepID=T0YQ16_9ZZZZ
MAMHMAGGSIRLDEMFTSIATPNMALVKYWGKRDERLILPMNSSISITLGEEFNTKTSVMFSNNAKEDSFSINGERQDLSNKDIKERFNVIDLMKKNGRY